MRRLRSTRQFAPFGNLIPPCPSLSRFTNANNRAVAGSKRRTETIRGQFFCQLTRCALGPGLSGGGVIQCALILGLVATGALIFIWMERKISGRIQDRLGPTRVGGKFGWLQTLADGLKLI